MSKIEILKAKLRSDLFITATYSETSSGEVNNVTKECGAPAHDDLRRAFRQLTPHLALISEQVRINYDGRKVDHGDESDAREKVMDPEELYTMSDADWKIVTAMECMGFSIGGSGDSEGVTIIGRRDLSSGSVLNLTSPFTKFQSDYSFTSELAELIETCKAEVYSYLFEGKHQPDAQMKIEFPEDEEMT